MQLALFNVLQNLCSKKLSTSYPFFSLIIHQLVPDNTVHLSHTKVLEMSHHREVRRITGMTEKRGADREWEYPSVMEATEAAELHPIRV